MLQNAYLVAKIGADTAENEQHFAEICQKLATTLRVPTTPPASFSSGHVLLQHECSDITQAFSALREESAAAQGLGVRASKIGEIRKI